MDCENDPIPNDSNDTAWIMPGYTVYFQSAQLTIDKLHIQSHGSNGGVLKFLPSGSPGGSTLTIAGAAGLNMDVEYADHGEIKFYGGGANSGVLAIGNNMNASGDITSDGGSYALAGYIDVLGSNELTLTSNGVITVPYGGLLIDGDFQNNGTIDVSAGYTVEFTGDGPAADSSGVFTIDHSSGKILINTSGSVDMTNTGAEFEIFNGSLDIDQTFTFDGSLTWTGGSIDVAANKRCEFD